MREDVGTDGRSDVEELEKGESGQEQYETQGRGLESLQEDYAGLRKPSCELMSGRNVTIEIRAAKIVNTATR